LHQDGDRDHDHRPRTGSVCDIDSRSRFELTADCIALLSTTTADATIAPDAGTGGTGSKSAHAISHTHARAMFRVGRTGVFARRQGRQWEIGELVVDEGCA
jgi:hypothetical protein